MKLLCVLTSFFLVNVLALINLTPFKMEVAITNVYIQDAFDNSDENGNELERVIETMVEESVIGYVVMNFMVTVPERASLTNADLDESIDQQRAMQDEITAVTGLPIPDVPDQDFANLNLSELGDARRVLTKEALKNIIIRALNANEPIVTGIQIIKFGQLCRFIGLWMSTLDPLLYIKATRIEVIFNMCILTNTADHDIKYRKINDEFCLVDVNNIDNKLIELVVQLSIL
ncbi:uncharacterized protein LOC126847859 [Adelges cooleyi]|uniref:uncharacterized protein LOC126847859 n=1 Tax=Adelges cooleyi TaxID=133065 RepID=UPI0021807D67|nr:uncharacterized protein LOC126847859 [Adelges cooleyi]